MILEKKLHGCRGRLRRAGWVLVATLLLGVVPVSAEVTGIKITKDETISINTTAVRHVAGVVLGRADRNEPDIPTLDKVMGLKYQSDFELWLPVAGGNGRFWFAVLNRGKDGGGRHRRGGEGP